MWYHGESASGAAALVLGLGALLGAAWGAFQRPTLLETAVEADRQLALHDLLGTAITLSRCAHADDATRAAIAAAADERCRRLAPSRMVLNQLGARAWAGIGLANALVLTLSLMSAAPTPTTAHGSNDELARANRTDLRPDDRTPSGSSPALPTSVARRAPTHSGDELRTAEPDGAVDGPRSSRHPGTSAATSGDGSASASQTDQFPSAVPRSMSTGRDPATGTIPAGGAGIASPSNDANDRAADGITRAARFPAPPWRAATGDADRARALRDVERGAVPDRYREMIRAYFDPDDTRQHR